MPRIVVQGPQPDTRVICWCSYEWRWAVDPAAAVNKDTGEANPYLSEVAADPRPFYRELRTACPVA